MSNPCYRCTKPVVTENLWKIRIDEKNRVFYYCRDCKTGVGGIPDVYFGSKGGIQTEENIADPETGEPIPFWSKASKKAAMDRAGVREGGDISIHGTNRNGDPILTRGRKHFVV